MLEPVWGVSIHADADYGHQVQVERRAVNQGDTLVDKAAFF